MLLDYLTLVVYVIVSFYALRLITSLEAVTNLDLSQKIDRQYREAIARAVAYARHKNGSLDVDEAVKALKNDIYGTILNLGKKDYEYDLISYSKEGK